MLPITAIVLGQTQFVCSKFGIFGGFGVRFKLTNLGLEGFEVRFFQIWAWVRSLNIFQGFERVRSSVLLDESGFKRVGSSTYQVRSSSKFDIPTWVRSNTILQHTSVWDVCDKREELLWAFHRKENWWTLI